MVGLRCASIPPGVVWCPVVAVVLAERGLVVVLVVVVLGGELLAGGVGHVAGVRGFGRELPWGERSGPVRWPRIGQSLDLPAIARWGSRSSRLAPWWLPKASRACHPWARLGLRFCRLRSGAVMGVRRKAVGGSLRTRGRGRVQVLEDGDGHQWVTCSGCRLDRYSPGVAPARAEARKHARDCVR